MLRFPRVFARGVDLRASAFAGAIACTTTRLRLIPGRWTPAVGTVFNDWYATGVGIVKRSARVVGSTRPVEVEEDLVSRDGISSGVGVMQTVRLQDMTAGGSAIPLVAVASVLDFETHVLLFSKRDFNSPLRVRSSAFDLRGPRSNVDRVCNGTDLEL